MKGAAISHGSFYVPGDENVMKPCLASRFDAKHGLSAMVSGHRLLLIQGSYFLTTQMLRNATGLP